MRGIYTLALSPEGKHLYVPMFNEGAVAVFTVGTNDGKLSLLQVCMFDASPCVCVCVCLCFVCVRAYVPQRRGCCLYCWYGTNDGKL